MTFFAIPAENGSGDGKFIIYRPLAGVAFIGNQRMVALARRFIQSPDALPEAQEAEAWTFLQQIGFARLDARPYQPRPVFSTAVLLLTNRCQLRCTYCYAAGGEQKPASLSIRTGQAAIDHVYHQAVEHGLDSFKVDFHGGGEPTMEWDRLRRLSEHALAKPVRATISLTSNGLWSRQQTEWLGAHADNICISMDGSPATQDRNRPLASGRPSSPQVMRNIARLDELGKDFGIRMTVQEPWQTLSEDVAFIFTRTGCRSIQVEPAFNTARGGHCSPMPVQVDGFARAFIDAHAVASAHQGRLTFSGARPEIITTIFCQSPYEGLVVNPDDQIVACYEITSRAHPLAGLATFGHVEGDTVIIDWEARAAFVRLAQERLASCQDCFCSWHCAGDCFTRGFEARDGGHLAKTTRCTLNQQLTRYKIMDHIAAGGGVWQRFNRMAEDDSLG